MSADASNDDEVRVQGAPGYEFLSALESVAAEAAPVVVAAEFPAGSDEEDDSGAEEGESASESEEGEVEMDSLGMCIPSSMQLVVHAPAVVNATLLGRAIVYKWNTGWARGVLFKHYARARGTKRYNFEVDYPFEAEGNDRRDHRLRPADYSVSEDAKVGSWALLLELRSVQQQEK